MNDDRVQMLREKLDNLTISDYHGLNSPGLTCYLNSVLQVLFMTEDFRSSIKRCRTEDSTAFDTLLAELFDDLEKDLAKTHRFIKTLGITDAYKQRDAAEYLEKILCHTSLEASKIFKGELHHKTTCVKCKTKNDSWTVFRILPLAMENSCQQTYSVERGLKAFFRKEQVCGENKLYCSRCNKKEDADIECEMTQPPSILTLLLKRFTFDHVRKRYVKLHCRVDVPQTLHMESCKYDLYAIVNHYGGLTGGHYTAEIKSFETGEWYCFNDDHVERVRQPLFRSGDPSVRSCTVYLLMYKKKKAHSERSDGVDQEAQRTQINVEAEGRYNGAEGGEADVPHHQLKDESCSRDENLNGDTLKTKKTERVCKKWMDSSCEAEKQSNQRAATVRPNKDVLQHSYEVQENTGHREPNKQHLNTNSDHRPANCVNSAFENHNFLKNRLNSHDITWDNTGQDNVVMTGTKTRVKCTETEGARARYPTKESHSIHRKTSSRKRNQQLEVSTGGGRTQKLTQTDKGTKGVSVKTTGKTKRSETVKPVARR